MFVPLSEEIEEQTAEQVFDIQTMIENSNSIIAFIQTSAIMQQDESLNLMMNQLQQLNLIA